MRRAVLMIMDSLGVGELPDAGNYHDRGANTLGHILDRYGEMQIPNLRSLGLGNIQGAAGGRLKTDKTPKGSFGKLAERSAGKDTITGHWEIAGLPTQTPFKTYPDGFPKEFIAEFEKAIGTKVLGNYPASGTEIIEVLGSEHEQTGKPIVYTSADSVFQIAANTDIIPLNRLYEICQIARGLLVGDWACGRVIARPYIVRDGKRQRTSDRKDYAVTPPEKTILDQISGAGKTVYAVGKINDIFNGRGVTDAVHTENNMDGVDKTLEALQMDFGGLIFTNLVDFDSKFGHRRNPEGYGKALEELDRRIPEILGSLKDEDILIFCADHGNDPIHSGWDHTREYIPAVFYGKQVRSGVDFGIRDSFADIGASICEYLEVPRTPAGHSFWDEIAVKK